MSRIRISLVAILAMGLLLMSVGIARADNIQDDLSADPGSRTAVVGQSVTATYQLTANNGDGQAGCNASDGSPAYVTINAPAHVTATPSTFKFTTCQQTDPNNAKTVTFTADAPGDYTITASVQDSGVGTYNTNPAAFILHVVAPDKPPVLDVPNDITIQTANAAGENVNYTVSATDDEDGDLTASVKCIPQSGSHFTVGATTVNCEVTDSAGHKVTDSFDITVQLLVVDEPPVISTSDIGPIEATGPTTPVTFNATASDNEDGNLTSSITYDHNNSFPVGDTNVTASVTDSFGHTVAAVFKVTIKDETPPALGQLPLKIVNATSAAGAVVNFDPVSAIDLVDGPVPVIFDNHQSGETFPLGITNVTYHATDAHGNTSSASFNVWVQVPCANGLNPPINNDGSSVFKLGSTVPVKFNCFPGLDAKLRWTKGDNAPDGLINEPASSNPATDGITFRYDETAGQYIFNLGTKNLSAGDWYLHVSLGDSVDHVTKIGLRK